MKYEYKNVSTDTLEGLKKAEKLHAAGWLIGSTGFYSVRFYRVKATK